MLGAVRTDAQTVTGRNLRNISLLTGKDPATTKDAPSMIYRRMLEKREWRLEVIELLLEERELGNLEEPDLELLEWLCTD